MVHRLKWLWWVKSYIMSSESKFRMDLRRHKPPFVVIRGVSIILRFRDAKTRARDRGAVRVGNRRWRFNCDDLSSLQRLVLRGARTQRTCGARGQCEQRPRTLPSLTLE